MGLPGRHGKKGMVGNQGIKGEKGETGEKGTLLSIIASGNHEIEVSIVKEVVLVTISHIYTPSLIFTEL